MCLSSQPCHTSLGCGATTGNTSQKIRSSAVLFPVACGAAYVSVFFLQDIVEAFVLFSPLLFPVQTKHLWIQLEYKTKTQKHTQAQGHSAMLQAPAETGCQTHSKMEQKK